MLLRQRAADQQRIRDGLSAEVTDFLILGVRDQRLESFHIGPFDNEKEVRN